MHDSLKIASLLGLLISSGSVLAQQPTDAQISAIRSACRGDYHSVCADVPTGGKPALQCLQQHADAVSNGCREALPPQPRCHPFRRRRLPRCPRCRCISKRSCCEMIAAVIFTSFARAYSWAVVELWPVCNRMPRNCRSCVSRPCSPLRKSEARRMRCCQSALA
jgi:hypothetical protein